MQSRWHFHRGLRFPRCFGPAVAAASASLSLSLSLSRWTSGKLRRRRLRRPAIGSRMHVCTRACTYTRDSRRKARQGGRNEVLTPRVVESLYPYPRQRRTVIILAALRGTTCRFFPGAARTDEFVLRVGHSRLQDDDEDDGRAALPQRLFHRRLFFFSSFPSLPPSLPRGVHARTHTCCAIMGGAGSHVLIIAPPFIGDHDARYRRRDRRRAIERGTSFHRDALSRAFPRARLH